MSDLARELSLADVGVALYRVREEFSGLKILDYKAAGLPTIASGRDGLPREIVDGETGVIVAPEDVGGVASAVAAMAKDPEGTRRMGRAARAEAEDKHSWRATAQGIEQVLLRARRKERS